MFNENMAFYISNSSKKQVYHVFCPLLQIGTPVDDLRH